MILVILLSIGAALLNGVSVVMQRKVAGNPQANELFRVPFIKGLTLNKHWLTGFSLQVLAFFLQAIALRYGPLVVVEPLLTIDLVFIMLILHYRYKVHSGIQEWSAVAMICLGLGGLLASAHTRPGQQSFELAYWAPAVTAILCFIVTAIFIVRRTKSSRRRAWIMGIAAGFSFALGAIFTKLTVQQLHLGIIAVLSGWQVYALLLSGILAVIMTQNTYGAGPIVMSQPTMEISEPVVCIAMGMLLFGDTIDLRPWALVLEILTGLVACLGIWLLGRSDSLQLQNITVNEDSLNNLPDIT
jgi:drug/metabolite transporter (DMT)-like permease